MRDLYGWPKMRRLVLKYANIVSQGAIFQSSVRFLDSLIEAVDSGNTSITSGMDVERGFNLPRAIDLNNKMIEQQA